MLPVVPLLLWAVADRWRAPALLPQEWGSRRLADAAAGRRRRRLRALAGCSGLVVAVLATPLGAMAGRALAVAAGARSTAVLAVLLSPLALPPVRRRAGPGRAAAAAAACPATLGVVVLLVVAALPYPTLTLRVAYAAHDRGFEEEARLLGASAVAVRASVLLPLLAPALAVAVFLAFLVGWSDYIVTVLIGGGRLVTLPLLVASAASATGNDAAVAVAVA